MRYSSWCVALIPLLCAPVPAMAQVAGTWRVKGDISGRAFMVYCRFDNQGGQLGGLCTEIDKNGRPGRQHILSQGTVRGSEIRWTYPGKVMMMSIDIDFAGTRDGAAMAGTVTAKGREGAFTAKRV